MHLIKGQASAVTEKRNEGDCMGFKNDDRCLDKVADDEPIFVLRAQDKCAPQVVRYWASLATGYGNPSSDKIIEAHNVAEMMEKWTPRKWPD